MPTSWAERTPYTTPARMLEAATGLKVSFKTVDRAFTRLKITHKKNYDGKACLMS